MVVGNIVKTIQRFSTTIAKNRNTIATTPPAEVITGFKNRAANRERGLGRLALDPNFPPSLTSVLSNSIRSNQVIRDTPAERIFRLLGDIIYGAADDKIGYDVAINSDGTVIAFGQYNSANTVSYYVYEWDDDNTRWVRRGDVITKNSTGGSNGSSLNKIDISGDGSRVVVSMPGDNANEGSISIYDWNGTAWSIPTSFTGTTSDERFGNDVSISGNGNYICVGSYNFNNDTGRVTIYRYNNDTWSKIETIDGNADNDRYGISVSLNSDATVLAVGADGVNDGAVYVYEIDGDNVALRANNNILEVSPQNIARFGYFVSISADGTRLAVGSDTPNTNNNIDKVHIFVWDNTTWSSLGDIQQYNNGNIFFGRSVSISGSGEYITIGDFQATKVNEDGPDNDNVGMVALYRYVNEEWTIQQEPIYGPINVLANKTGRHTAINNDGSIFIVSAYQDTDPDDGGNDNHGSVAVYKYS